jgi:predicted nucleic-acid-binding protein
MRAVDTNIVVRYVMNDDAAQAGRARRLVDGANVFVPATVVQETEWVLRTIYRLSAGSISAALRQFMGLPTTRLEHPERLAAALAWFEGGMDFADALHLAAARDCDGLATLDRDFIKVAARIGAGNVAEP